MITSPSADEQIHPGFHEIRGLAWSGARAGDEGRVSVDGDAPGKAPSFQEPVLPKCHTRFRFPWRWNGTKRFCKADASMRRAMSNQHVRSS